MQDSVVINQQLISYNVLNRDGKKALVFLHGWRSRGLVWKDVADKINNQEFAVYMLDLPGFGSSPKPRNPFSVGDYADVVAEFIKKLKLNNVILIGHSFGGRVAIKLLAMYPDSAEKLVLVDSAGVGVGKIREASFLAKIAKPFFKPNFMQGLKKKIYKKIGAEDYVATPQLKETFLKVINEDLSGQLAQIDKPTLIVWGKDDKETPLESGKIINGKIKNSKLVVLENAGHFSFLDKPKEFFGELVKFIG
jgi:pimeloyl-ACP methyl ester carboxylesterase